VGWLVRRYVASRTDVTLKAREQYEWAIPHIEAGLGAIRLDRLDREDVARWLDESQARVFTVRAEPVYPPRAARRG
jgi:hypothetical protein